jgi:hypothetical protein
MDDEKGGQKNQEDSKKKVLLEKFKIAAEIQDNYNNLFWTRTTVFFAINTALFAGYGLMATEILKILLNSRIPVEALIITLMLVIFGIVGVYLSWLWQQIHRRATFLQNYYRFRASVIEKSIGIEPAIFGQSYEIATAEKALEKSDKEWEEVYGGEWQKKKAEWQEKSIELEKQFEDIKAEKWEKEKSKDASSLRDRLDRVYLVFIYAWISLSVLGVAILIISSVSRLD